MKVQPKSKRANRPKLHVQHAEERRGERGDAPFPFLLPRPGQHIVADVPGLFTRALALEL
eukprot:scaffold128895_cov33-Tisochrysis_lutea.AAC.1